MWVELPEEFGKSNSVWRTFNRWSQAGLWEWILDHINGDFPDFKAWLIVDGTHIKAHQDSTRSPLSAESQKLGKTKGGRNSKISASVNSQGKAVKLVLVCGNEHDSLSFFDTIPAVFEGFHILADKAYDSNHIRNTIKEGKGIAVIPPKKNRVSIIEYDKEVGKNRGIVENFFCRIKRFRRVNTRYEQTARNYLAFVHLASIADWMR